MTDTPLPPTAAPSVASAGPPPHGGFTTAQLQTLAGDLVSHGIKTREEVNAGLAADGVAPLPDPAAPPSENLSPQAAQIDAAFPVPESPMEYVIPKLAPDDQPLTDQHFEFDKTARAWLMDARLPAGIGSSIAEAVAQTDKQWATLDENGRELFKRSEWATVERVLGPNARQRLDLAKHLVNELEQKRPGVKALLDQTGAGNSSTVIIQMITHAERLLARKA